MPLTIVPTPIGNLEDVTLRALRVLKNADLIACEDTRTSGVFLRRYGISKPLISLHDHNERERSSQLMRDLREGKNIAVVSDAGTPGISDPGYVLLRSALDEGLEVDVLPGPSALLPALLLSGLVPHPFAFYAFPPEKPGQRRRLFESAATWPHTLVFYLSPHKAERQIAEMIEVWGDRNAAVVREISKIYQEAIRGPLSEVQSRFRAGLKGEMVLVVEGASGSGQESSDAWKKRVEELLEEGVSVKGIVEEITEKFHAAKNEIKAFALGKISGK